MSFTDTDLSSFLELPTEVRLQIWRDAAEVALNPRRAIVQDTAVLPRDIPVLDINQEAREEVLFRTDLKRFRRPTLDDQGANDSPPSWDWFSMEKDIFVIGVSLRIPERLYNNEALRNAIQTIAIPSHFLQYPYRHHRPLRDAQLHQIFNYQALKTVVLLRNDKAQEKITYKNLVQFTRHHPNTGDLRIAIDSEPMSELELAEAVQSESLFDTFPGPLPEFRWGCLVRH
ncbi:9a21e09c-24c1-4abc-b5d1-ce24a21de6f2 [Sclerotinia trifoliorum]|uniref:9a21e09c-24c1-4abc-b5d1-ce24a21de6f2 n=1 Tax=Sclerotinia trifoliorum TaxID=28548 RepID=A0A8H2W3U1_9HELO|nr:9a21e09c-24c1-4abc-b5d1-ce24a21de6f2 [Sclerotinia trifoliorum]